MPEEALKVACNACQVALEGPTESYPQDAFFCPSCGLTETCETVMRELGEYVESVLALELQKGMADAVRGSEGVKFTPDEIPEKVYRFVLLKG